MNFEFSLVCRIPACFCGGSCDEWVFRLQVSGIKSQVSGLKSFLTTVGTMEAQRAQRYF